MSKGKLLLLLPLLACLCVGCALPGGVFGRTPPPTATSAPMPTMSATIHLGQRTKTTGCQVRGPLPDAACTPGAIFPAVTLKQVCTAGYASGVRNVPASEKVAVYKEYGITHHTTGQYEVDHLVSLELGGSNAIANLWPEAASPKPGFHEKDAVENSLHARMCSGKMTLAEAQREIAVNWLTVYQSRT